MHTKRVFLGIFGLLLLVLAAARLVGFNSGYLSLLTSISNNLDHYYKASSLRLNVSPDNLPSRFKFKWEVLNGSTISSIYKRSGDISFRAPDKYLSVKGVTTFRGNTYRNSSSYGSAKVSEEKLEKIWSYGIGRIDSWTGVGWNGQPAIVMWDEDIKNRMNLMEQKKKSDLKEVIYGTLDSKVYFLDLDTGEPTRYPIKTPGPIKGSVTVDPRGYPLLYVGQGINTVGGKKVPVGYGIYNLLDQKRLYFINGLDSFAFRRWGAFDSTCLVDAKRDTMVEAGENGVLYVAKLNTSYNPDENSISVKPKLTKYRYKASESKRMGIENSVAIHKNLAYFSDNDGILQCVDLNTLSPVWVRDVTDDTDSTIVLEETGEGVSLYTGCEVDHQGKNGYSFIRRIDGLTGRLMWERSFKCYYSITNGGVMGTPVIGKNDIDHLVVFSLAKNNSYRGGSLIALSKKTGDTVWEIPLSNYSWSSPVDLYTSDGKAYIIFCDSAGNMFLIDGKKGRILDRISLGSNIEGSPAVYENMVVVGTRGQKIWGIKIR